MLKICVSPRSLGGGVPSDAQDHPQHHQDCLADIFADANGVLLFQAMLESAWGLGGAKCSDVEELFEFEKMSVLVQSPTCTEQLSCFWKSIFRVFEGGC